MEFFGRYNGKSFVYDKETRRITKLDHEAKTIYGYVKIREQDRGVYEWRLRLDRVTNNQCAIGLDASNQKWTNTNFVHADNNKNYSIGPGCKYSQNGKSPASLFRDGFKTNDIVRVQFNGETNVLLFASNNDPLRKEFVVSRKMGSDIYYSLAIYLKHKHDAVTLLEYTYTQRSKKESFPIQVESDIDTACEMKESAENTEQKERDKGDASSTGLDDSDRVIVGSIKAEELEQMKSELEQHRLYRVCQESVVLALQNQLLLAQKALFEEKMMNIIRMKREREQNEMKVMEIKIKYMKSQKLFTSFSRLIEYKHWNAQAIVTWIVSLHDGRFAKYESTLNEAFWRQRVNGEYLEKMQMTDLKRWGIEDENDCHCLWFDIQILRNQAFAGSGAQEQPEGSSLF